VSANLDLVRSIYADWERGDFGRSDWAHPEVKFVVVDGPEPGTWTGLADLAHAVRPILASWRDYHYAVDEYRELDGGRVLVLFRRSGRGKTSGLEIDQLGGKGADLFHVRGGKVTRLINYWDRDRALADLGLEG
jgi:ketosteroid isomerase-like protein